MSGACWWQICQRQNKGDFRSLFEACGRCQSRVTHKSCGQPGYKIKQRAIRGQCRNRCGGRAWEGSAMWRWKRIIIYRVEGIYILQASQNFLNERQHPLRCISSTNFSLHAWPSVQQQQQQQQQQQAASCELQHRRRLHMSNHASPPKTQHQHWSNNNTKDLQWKIIFRKAREFFGP